jgi:hypothetical protein
MRSTLDFISKSSFLSGATHAFVSPLNSAACSLLDAVRYGTRDLKELIRSYEYLVEDSTRTMNRLKALYRSRAIACAGTDISKLQRRGDWLAKLEGVGARAERLYSELDHLTLLRREARRAFVAECRRHPASKIHVHCKEISSRRAANYALGVREWFGDPRHKGRELGWAVVRSSD